MKSTLTYIKEWQKALQIEILHLKKYGSTKYPLMNGRLLSEGEGFTYFFDTIRSSHIPVSSRVKIEFGHVTIEGRVLSSEGKSVILKFERSFGDIIPEALLFHDPWELLEQLIQRLEEMKKSKQKRIRIKKLMNPSMPAKHPTEIIKNNIHELRLRSKYNPVTYIWGPPGTGKTYTLARVAAYTYFKQKRILILSHTNQAVDLLMKEILTFITKKERFIVGDILRYGSNVNDSLATNNELTTNQLIEHFDPKLVEEKDNLIEERRLVKMDLAHSFSKRDTEQLLKIEARLTKLLEKIRQKEIQFVKEAYIVGTTLARAASDESVYTKDFDLVIVDEASMAYVPQAAFAASLGKHVIICGDFKQLPPIANARHDLVNHWLKEDIFHRTGIVDWLKYGKLHPHLFLLKEQRRMHPDISEFTNHYIYKSLVGNHKRVGEKRKKIAEKAPFPNRASVLLDTSYTGEHCTREKLSNSRMNPWHLFLSFQLIHEAYLAGTKSIGYVTPYRAQAVLMDNLLNDVYKQEISSADIISATVHRFQGSERDVMIFDTVDSNPIERVGMLLVGNESERLINVAITRTKGKFINVADRAYIQQNVHENKTLRQLVQHQIKNNQVISPSKIGSWIKNQHTCLQWMHARKLKYIFKDIQNAIQSIVIAIPDHSELSKEWVEQLENRHKKVCLTVISDHSHLKIHPDTWIEESFPYPFVIIDERYFWLGLPLEGAKSVEPPFVAARLESAQVSEQFLRQIPIKKTTGRN